MRLFIYVLFLTLVLTCRITVAAPQTTMEPNSIETPLKNKEKTGDSNPEKTEPTRLSYPPGSLPNENISAPAIGINPRSPDDVTVYLGTIYGQVKTADSTMQSQYLGFSWIHEEKLDSAWGINVDVNSNQTVGAGIFRRIYISDSDFSLSPYAKYGLADYFEPSEFLGTFINISRIKFTAAMGFNDLYEKNHHWYGELGMGLGTIGALFYAQVGYTYNF